MANHDQEEDKRKCELNYVQLSWLKPFDQVDESEGKHNQCLFEMELAKLGKTVLS